MQKLDHQAGERSQTKINDPPDLPEKRARKKNDSRGHTEKERGINENTYHVQKVPLIKESIAGHLMIVLKKMAGKEKPGGRNLQP